MNTSDEDIGIIGSIRVHNGNHEPSQLNWKKNRARFNYYEHDTLKRAPASDLQNLFVCDTALDFLEHLEDSEHD